MRLTNGSASSKPSYGSGTFLSLFLLSAAVLAFEINLTRLFSVAQFYHFSFMIVSIALLGFGASGTALTLFPTLQKGEPGLRLGQLGFATGISTLIAFLLTSWLPFDSFSIAWDRKQVWILILHYITLAAPFFFTGMALAFLLKASPQSAGTIYAINLLGSAAGCIIALTAPSVLGAEGLVTLCAALASLAGIVAPSGPFRFRKQIVLAAGGLIIFSLLDIGLRIDGRPSFSILELNLSPYKSLSYAMQSPGASIVEQRWNAFSRVDVVRSNAFHSLPGLSYRYLSPLPSMDGVLVDGDDISPILNPEVDSKFAAYLPVAVAFHLRPHADVLVTEPRGGLDVFSALALSSGQITATEINPLIIDASPLYDDPRVQVYIESDRSYLRRTRSQYDVIILSLASSFHPVRSGAYSLAEDYRYTVEAFKDALARLTSGGIMVVTRWLQYPPSEDLRLFALGVTALEISNLDPRSRIVAFRGFNTATILLKNGSFTPGELSSIRDFLGQRAFDLTYAPGIRPEETNQYNILPDPVYFHVYADFLNSYPRYIFYDDYEYDVRPPTDDHPFFGHYFKWTQAPQVIAELGRAWQPFGGAGYFVIVALLFLAIVLAAALILLPVAIQKISVKHALSPFPLLNLLYFGLIGFAFLFVEIPLLQHFILYLGNPAYAATVVLFSLLFFSGLGSRWSDQIPLGSALVVLIILVLALPFLLHRLFSLTIGLEIPLRLSLAALILSPFGFLMGIPFPTGIRTIRPEHVHGIPWVWAVNGASSVVASILAALLALSFGFSTVLGLGALCYAAAGITVLAQSGVLRRRDR